MAKKTKNSSSPSLQAQLKFSDDSCTDKVSESGHNFFHGTSNAEGLLGDLAAGVVVDKYSPVYVFNTTGSTAFVAFGDAGLAAPTGGANGIPIPAARGLMLNSGDNTVIRSSVAGLFGYTPVSDIVEI